MKRRTFISGVASLLVTPALVKAGSLDYVPRGSLLLRETIIPGLGTLWQDLEGTIPARVGKAIMRVDPVPRSYDPLGWGSWGFAQSMVQANKAEAPTLIRAPGTLAGVAVMFDHTSPEWLYPVEADTDAKMLFRPDWVDGA